MGPGRPGCSCWGDPEPQLGDLYSTPHPHPQVSLGQEAPAWGRGVGIGPSGPGPGKQTSPGQIYCEVFRKWSLHLGAPWGTLGWEVPGLRCPLLFRPLGCARTAHLPRDSQAQRPSTCRRFSQCPLLGTLGIASPGCPLQAFSSRPLLPSVSVAGVGLGRRAWQAWGLLPAPSPQRPAPGPGPTETAGRGSSESGTGQLAGPKSALCAPGAAAQAVNEW